MAERPPLSQIGDAMTSPAITSSSVLQNGLRRSETISQEN
jgi:hypothetical protein